MPTIPRRLRIPDSLSGDGSPRNELNRGVGDAFCGRLGAGEQSGDECESNVSLV